MSTYPNDPPPKYEPPTEGYPPKYEPPAGAYPPPNQPAGAYPPPNQPAGAYPPPNQPAGAYPPPNQPSVAGYPPMPGYQTGQPVVASYQLPPGSYPHQHGPSTVVIAQPHAGPIGGSLMRFGQSPALIVCQHCQATVTTSTDYTIGLMSWLLVGGVCLVGCCAGCCFIPLCIDAGKDVVHTCPNCKKQVGMYKQIR